MTLEFHYRNIISYRKRRIIVLFKRLAYMMKMAQWYFGGGGGIISKCRQCQRFLYYLPLEIVDPIHNPLPRNALLHVWMRYRHWMKFTPWFCERKCLKLLMTIFFSLFGYYLPFQRGSTLHSNQSMKNTVT